MGEEVNMAIIQLNGDKQNFILDKKDFKTGSKGYYSNGKMVAARAEYQSGEFMISYRCLACGKCSRVRAAEGDNRELLMRLASPPKK